MVTYYVSITGNDTNPGTQKSPFRTYERAVSVAGSHEEDVKIIQC